MTQFDTSNLSLAPVLTGGVDQRYLLEPLSTPLDPKSYLDRFPEEVYDKSLQSHLVRFIYTLLGPSGVASIKQNILNQRLLFEAHGLALFDLEDFYGDPFAFGRILDEQYDQNLQGLLPPEDWATIRAKDEKYRSRAIDFMKGVRGGNTPLGMKLIARSGIGHEVEVIENHQFLFDNHSDDTLELTYQGKTNQVEEFIVFPRMEVSRNEVQVINFIGFPDGGTCNFGLNEVYTSALPWDATFLDVQAALEPVPGIGVGNVQVSGGPIPDPFTVTFRGALAGEDVPQLTAFNALVDLSGGPDNPATDIFIETTASGKDSADEVVNISSADRHNLQAALDRIGPVTAISTTKEASGATAIQRWRKIHTTSEYVDNRVFVRGEPTVPWPPTDDARWIEPDVENEAPVVHRASRNHYVNFHRAAGIRAYTDAALDDPNYLTAIPSPDPYKSEYFGQFSNAQCKIFPFLIEPGSRDIVFEAKAALDPNPNAPRMTGYLDGIIPGPVFDWSYPIDYYRLRYSSFYQDHHPQSDAPFWASLERTEGSDYLEIDLGEAKAVNYLSFLVSRKPLSIDIAYDILDASPRRSFTATYPYEPTVYTTHIAYSPFLNPWEEARVHFQTRAGTIPFTRYLRLRFNRQTTSETTQSDSQQFLFDPVTHTQNAWSVEVRNLRLGRVVSQIDSAPGKYWQHWPDGGWWDGWR